MGGRDTFGGGIEEDFDGLGGGGRGRDGCSADDVLGAGAAEEHCCGKHWGQNEREKATITEPCLL